MSPISPHLLHPLFCSQPVINDVYVIDGIPQLIFVCSSYTIEVRVDFIIMSLKSLKFAHQAIGTRILEFLFHLRSDLLRILCSRIIAAFNIRSIDEAIVIGVAHSLSFSAFVLQSNMNPFEDVDDEGKKEGIRSKKNEVIYIELMK
ncbi:hypothetical protein FNV43_RR17627 [Rhamnella rubrinervis]|uniref:Uncharacterized protein n=1 Tax=Rhamnella rubrinervis TaxID=2594499 RepID=A0A8K0E4M5_9ROSA|nr:hypothetical protein FNV43_RR17627 [Rhamnella rubrinervis]